MLSHLHYATAALWLSAAIAGLSWTMLCAFTANKMKQEGVSFWNAFLTCFVLTPGVGILVIGVARLMRSNRPLVQTATRG
jgi:hypothetical protein